MQKMPPASLSTVVHESVIPRTLTPTTTSVLPDNSNAHTLEMQITLNQIANVNRAKCKDAGWAMVARVSVLNTGYSAETSKIQITTLSHTLDQKLTIQLKINTLQEIDEFLYYPLLVNFYEIVAVVIKDKKKLVEEKFDLVGQSTVDLIPFFKGDTNIHGKWTVYPVAIVDSKADSAALQAAASELPECSLSIVLSKPLIPQTFQDSMNIIIINLLGFYSMPEQWLTAPGAKSQSLGFTVVTAIPKQEGQERFLVSSGRTVLLKASSQFQKRWPSHSSIVTDAIFRQETCTVPEKQYFAETGSLSESKDWRDRYSMEHSRPFLPVCTEFRCVLSEEAANKLRTTTMETQVLPVEVFELTHPEKHAGTKKKGGTDGGTINTDDLIITRHGIVYINMKPILYPGKQDILGAYPVCKFDGQNLMKKANRTSLGVEIIKTSAVLTIQSSSEKDDRFSIIARKTTDSDHHAYPVKPRSTDQTLTAEAEPRLYEDSKTYLYAEIHLQKPIAETLVQDDAVGKVTQIITPKLPLPLTSDEAASQAEVAFQKQMEGIFAVLAEQFASQVGLAQSILVNLERNLTASGDFHVIKEQLKLNIIHLIRDKYRKRQSIDDPSEFDKFLATLYEDLVQQSLTAFNTLKQRCYDLPVDASIPQNIDSLKMQAIEAELDKNETRAEKSFLERTKLAPRNVNVWRDLGHFFLRWKKYDQAKAAFKRMLIDNIADFDGLLLLGNCFLEAGDSETAAVFFESVTVLFPESPLGWTALGLFYIVSPRASSNRTEIMVEYAFYQANLCIDSDKRRRGLFEDFLKTLEEEKIVKLAQSVPVDPTKPPTIGCAPTPSTRLETDSRGVLKAGPRKDNKVQLANVSQDPDKTRDSHKNEPVFSHLLAASLSEPNNPVPAENIFWCAIGPLVSLGLHRLTLRCAAYLNDIVKVNDPVYWRSVVLSLIETRQFDEAAKWLNQVKLLDVETADIFALYGHVNYFRDELEAADINYRRALNLLTSVSDPFQLYFCSGRIAEKFGHHDRATEMFYRAATFYPTCETWLGCGKAYYHLEDMDNAECALQEANYIDNSNPIVWAYLSMVASRKGLKVTAERCYRSAVTFGIEGFRDMQSLLENKQ